MAHDIQIIKEVDGANKGLARVVVTSDGTSPDLTNAVILDSSALTKGTPITQILGIEYSTVGASCSLSFGGTPNLPIISFPKDDQGEVCYCKAQLPNTALLKTGDVLLSTTGLNTTGASITLRIKYKKETV